MHLADALPFDGKKIQTMGAFPDVTKTKTKLAEKIILGRIFEALPEALLKIEHHTHFKLKIH